MLISEDIMVSDGTMSLEIGTWVNIKKGKIKMENKIKKYIVMSKFGHSDRFMLEKQFLIENKLCKPKVVN